MKNIKTYNQYIKEDLEPLKDKLANNTNTENKSDDSMNVLVKQIEQVSTQIEAKKTELNKNLENLEKLQIDNFTDQNKEYAEKTKKDIQTKVDALNEQIENLNKSVELFKKQLEELKEKMIKKFYQYITNLNQDNQFLKTKLDIRNWLRNKNIFFYTINNDLFVYIDGNLCLDYLEFEYLPVKFNRINGNFECNHTKLKSLKGFPEVVNGKLSLNNNIRLKDLKYIPRIIKGDFFCQDNYIENINDLEPKLFIKNYEMGWIHHLKKEVYDKYFLEWKDTEPVIIKYLESLVSSKIRKEYKHLFDATKFDLI